MLDLSAIIEGEWLDWYALTPAERWEQSHVLWEHYLNIGGSLDPEPDTQSPFFDPEAPSSGTAHGRPSLHIIRRGRV